MTNEPINRIDIDYDVKLEPVFIITDEILFNVIQAMKVAQFGKYVDQIEMTQSKYLEYKRMALAAIKEISKPKALLYVPNEAD